MGWEHLCDTLPYWGGRFDDTDSHLKGQKMIEQLNAPFKDKTATKIIAAKIARKFGNK